MKRGFSTIEILVAFAILASTLVAVSLVAYGAPAMIGNAYAELAAAAAADAPLVRAELIARKRFDTLVDSATISLTGHTLSLTLESIGDDLGMRITSSTGWKNNAGKDQSLSYEALVTDGKNAALHPCDPFISGDWSRPRVLGSYVLAPGDLLPGTILNARFPISALAVNGTILAVAISSTTSATDPTLFFFDIHDPNTKPQLIPASFDNAPISHTGYVALTNGPGIFFAANGFGSTNPASCAADSVSCAQLQTFSITGPVPVRESLFSIPTTSPSRAITASGSLAAGSALAYRNGYVYLGLEKTASGQEFQVVDVRDPQHPHQTGGLGVGRSISDIATASSTVYVTTDDNSSAGKAVLAIDMHEAAQPAETAAIRFTGGGFARRLVRSGSRLFVGRSYAAGTSEELPILDRCNLHALTHIGGMDTGTSQTPGGVRGLVVRDFLTFVLSESMLRIWNTVGPAVPIGTFLYASLPLTHGVGTALTCRNNVLYIGSADSSGTGYLTVVTSS